MTEYRDRSAALESLATETLDAFTNIAGGADSSLKSSRPVDITAIANTNQMTMEKALGNLQRMHGEMQEAWRHLRDEPAIARVVVADEDGNRQTLYIARAAAGGRYGVTLCSYLAPMGRLASFPVGGGTEIRLPKGKCGSMSSSARSISLRRMRWAGIHSIPSSTPKHSARSRSPRFAPCWRRRRIRAMCWPSWTAC
jgi:hypothetical protein